MVRIVKGVQKVFVEGVYILKAGEAIEYGLKFLAKGLCGVFDLSSVETCNTMSIRSLSTPFIEITDFESE